MTNFLQVKDNAKTLAPINSLNNTTNPLVVSGINTSSFPAVTTGYVVTIWNDLIYPDPGDDPNMEKATVTAATIATNGSFTLSRSSAKAHFGFPRVALLGIAQHISDLNTAVNAAYSPGNPVPNATSSVLGIMTLGGDLGGTASAPLTIRRKTLKVVNRLSPLPSDFHCSNYATDDLAMNAAIQAAAVLGDGTAVEYSGTLVLAAPIIPASGVDVFGQGRYLSKLTLTPGAQFAFVDSKSVYSINNPWTNSTWSDMEIDGSNADFDFVGGSKGFDGHGIVNVNILRCYIHDTSASGMGLDYPYNCKIKDNTIVRCGWVGKRVITAASWSASVITFTTSAAHGYTGSVKAVGTFTASGSISDGDTATLGVVVYTFKNTLTGAAYEVNIGGSTATALANLKKAVNLTGVSGTDYGTGTLIHQLITGGTITSTTLALAAKNYGTGGNALATTTTSAGASFGASTLLGGTTGNRIVVGLMLPIGYNGIYNVSTVIDATHFTVDASINNSGLLNLGFNPGTATQFGLAGTFNVGCNGVGIASGGLLEESVLVSGNFCYGNKNNNYLVEANSAITGPNASYIFSDNWSGYAGQAGFRNTGARNVQVNDFYDYGSLDSGYIDAFPVAKTITAASWSASVITFTTSAAHSYTVGKNLGVTGMITTAYNGYYQVASIPTTTTFTVALAADPGTAVFDANSAGPKSTTINSPTCGTQFNGFHSIGAGQYGLLVDPYCDGYTLNDVVITSPLHYGMYLQAGNASVTGGSKVYRAGRDGVRIVSGGTYWPINDIDLSSLHTYDNGQLTTGDGLVIDSTTSTPINNVTAPGLHAFDDQTTPTQRYGILVTSGGSNKNIHLAGAIAYGNKTQDISIQNTGDTIYTNNNVGLNPIGKVTLGSVSGTVAIDTTKGSYFTMTLVGNIVLTFPLSTTGLIIGTKMTLVVKQDTTGGRTWTLPGNSTSRQGGPATLSTPVNSIDIFTFSWDGAMWQEETRDLAVSNFVDISTAQTITATKTISKPAATSELIINADTGQVEQVRFRKNNADDWVMKSTSGSDLVFLNSNGSVNSMVIRNATNRVDFANGIYLPEISDMTGTPTGLYMFSDLSGNLKLKLANSHFLKLVTSGITTDRTLTFPDVTDTLVGKATTDVLTNKTLTSPTFTGSVTTPTPSAATDAVNKSYVDAIAQGLDVKASVRVASNTNHSLSAPGTIDSVTLATNDRALLKNQTTASENGPYIYNGSALVRATDADTSAKVTSGMFTFVSEGTNNAGNGYVLTTADPITLDTTGLTFTQFSGAGQITAGAGLTKTGNTLDIGAGSSKVSIAADSIDVVPANFTGIPESGITSLTTDLAAKEATANKGAASGYASLDSTTKVPLAQLPSGSELLDTLRKRPVLFSDFLVAAGSSSDPFLGTAIASGTLTTPNSATVTTNHPGLARLRSSTTTNSGVFLGTNTNQILLGGNEVYGAVFEIDTLALSTFRIGFHNSASSADAADGVYVEIASTGVATGKTANNSSRSSTASTYTLSASTWYRIRIVVTNTSLATFYIYDDSGTQLWTDTLTTTIPSSRTCGALVTATNSGTTAVDLTHLDWMAVTWGADRVR